MNKEINKKLKNIFLALIIGVLSLNIGICAKEITSQLEPTFNAPTGITIDKEGTIWVADSGHHRIVSFKPGKFKETFKSYGKQGSGKGEFNSPEGICLDSNNTVWVADSNNNRIVNFNPNNFNKDFITYGEEGKGVGNFSYPTGITIDNHQNVLVVDSTNHRIVMFNKSNFQNSFKMFGGMHITSKTEKGDLIGPHYGIQILKEKKILISDGYKYLVLFDPNNYIESFTTINIQAVNGKKIDFPAGLSANNYPYIWLADTWNHRILYFNINNPNKKITSFGKEGMKLGQFYCPYGLNVSGNIVWVADTNNSRIVSFDKNNFEKTFTVYGQGEKVEPFGAEY